MFKIVTPISHLFLNSNSAKKIYQNSDYLEIRERTINLNFKNEKFFHCDHDLTLPWSQKFKKELFKIILKKKKIKYISFQSTRCCINQKIVNNFFILSGKKLTRSELLNNAKKNIFWFREKFGFKFLIGLENNNYYPSEAYDIITNSDFITDVVRDNKLFFLFDIAHAKITASNRKINYQDYLEGLPMNQMLQIHICKPKLNRKLSLDTHDFPDKPLLDEVVDLSKKHKKLKFFTFEYYKDTRKLIETIILLKSLIKKNNKKAY
jgi:hypothetical protein